jgi:hypothetical protein
MKRMFHAENRLLTMLEAIDQVLDAQVMVRAHFPA